jgi:hypothetical protein
MDLQSFDNDIMSFPDPSEFDYAAFLQADDVGFTDPMQGQSAASLSGSSGEGMHTPPDPGARGLSGNGDNGNPLDLSLRRLPEQGRLRLERRGHTKSRRGCYNCKRRRIKVKAQRNASVAIGRTQKADATVAACAPLQCQETHPACGHCLKTGLKCEYPASPQITHQVCLERTSAIHSASGRHRELR